MAYMCPLGHSYQCPDPLNSTDTAATTSLVVCSLQAAVFTIRACSSSGTWLRTASHSCMARSNSVILVSRDAHCTIAFTATASSVTENMQQCTCQGNNITTRYGWMTFEAAPLSQMLEVIRRSCIRRLTCCKSTPDGQQRCFHNVGISVRPSHWGPALRAARRSKV